MARVLIALALCTTACAAPGTWQYVKAPLELPAVKTDGFSEAELAIEARLQKAAQSPACPKTFAGQIPAAVFVFADHPGFILTGTASAQGCALERGAKPGVEFVVPVDEANITALADILSDDVVTEEELYRIQYVTYVPGLAAAFRAEPLYKPEVARALDLPPVIHFTLLNPSGFEYRGSREPRRATAILENSTWRVVDGHQGEAKLSLEVTVEQAARFGQIVQVPDPNRSEAERVKDLKTLIASVATR